MNISSSDYPVLQAPGKGLPKYELFIARMLIAFKSRRTSREQAEAIFEFEKTELLRLAKKIDPLLGSKQVLIKRLRGLEDSSRFWSVFMTLDHLRIVNQGTTDLIKALVEGQTPARIVSTAEVKPDPKSGITVIQEFENVCNKFQEMICKTDSLKTKLSWAHPWFGELNAEKWHFFAGFHMSLHKLQILSIHEQLIDPK